MSSTTRRGATLAAAALLTLACGSTGATPSIRVPASPSPTASAPVAAATSSTAPGSAAQTAAPSATRNPSAGYTDLKGWLVFEHFGQAPDGSTPTFDFDNRMIWMVHADGSGLHELTPKKPLDGKSSPDISPDGQTIAFSSWSPHSQLWTVPTDGSADPTLVSTGCSGRPGDCQEYEPSWSGDGRSLAYVHAGGTGDAAYTEIALRDLGTGESHALSQTRMSATTGYVTQPSLSPDARAVVYYVVAQTPTQEHPTGSKVSVAATNGTDVRDLPNPPSSPWASDPDWSPDGKSIVFGTLPNSGVRGLGRSAGRRLWRSLDDQSGWVTSGRCMSCMPHLSGRRQRRQHSQLDSRRPDPLLGLQDMGADERRRIRGCPYQFGQAHLERRRPRLQLRRLPSADPVMSVAYRKQLIS